MLTERYGCMSARRSVLPCPSPIDPASLLTLSGHRDRAPNTDPHFGQGHNSPISIGTLCRLNRPPQRLRGKITKAELDRLLDPSRHVGLSAELVELACADAKRRLGT